MKLYVDIPLFDGDFTDIERLWSECGQSGCDGVVAGLRDPATTGAGVELKIQCEVLGRLFDRLPEGFDLIAGAHDSMAIAAIAERSVTAVWLPPAASHQPELVQRAAGLGVPVLAAVNGLGAPRGFEALLKACDGVPTTLCYLAAKGEAILSMLIQLAWLRAKGYPVGLVTDYEVELQSAAALGAEALVISQARVRKEDWRDIADGLRRIADAARGSGPRPITLGEMDGLQKEVPVLVAARRLEAGEAITKADVAVRLLRQRGLAPFMLEAIVGRRLRYGLDPGGPLNFGFLKEPGEL